MDIFKLIATVLLPLLLYCLLMWMIAAIGGWSALAKRYRSNQSNLGKTFRMRSAKFGIVNYSNCLTMSVSPAGLQISIWPLFRFAHPPLLIPWTEFQRVRERRIFFLFPIFEAAIGTTAIAYLQLPHWIADYFHAAMETADRSTATYTEIAASNSSKDSPKATIV